MCINGDTSGPDNLIAYLHSNDTITLDVDKAGQVRSFASNRNRFKLRFSSTANGSDTGLGLFYNISGAIIKYSTNGSVTCHNPEYYKPNNCAYATKQFQGLKHFSQDKNITRITGTRLSDGRFLFSVHTINQAGTADYFQVLLTKDGLLATAKKCSHRTATALASIGVRNGAELLIVAFDELVGLYDYDSMENSELVISRKIDYRSSYDWLGCEPDFCFDASLDGATAVTSDEFVLYRGNHVVDLQYNIHSATSTKFWIDSIEKMFPLNGTYPSFITSRDDQCAVSSNTTMAASCGTLFGNLSLISPQLYIDAIFILPNAVDTYVVRGDQYILYHTYQSNFTYKERGFIRDLYSGLPDKIDGATQHKEYILFIRDDFVHWAKVVELKQNATVFKTTLVQEFFKNGACNDNFYATSGPAQTLEISTFEEFKYYRMSSSITTTTRHTTVSTTQSSTLEQARHFSIYTLFAVIIGLMLLTIIPICYIMQSSKSGDEVAILSPFTDDTRTNVSQVSVSQASVTADA
ncbi:hypothetical protein HDE_01570 [Halotydeus destructor]|nr:hypothetical protein HDE_01570 [Halotydeus destructor]